MLQHVIPGDSLIVKLLYGCRLSGQYCLLILSGQIGRKEDDTVPDDPVEQLRVALENLRRNLQAAHVDVNDIVKLGMV